MANFETIMAVLEPHAIEALERTLARHAPSAWGIEIQHDLIDRARRLAVHLPDAEPLMSAETLIRATSLETEVKSRFDEIVNRHERSLQTQRSARSAAASFHEALESFVREVATPVAAAISMTSSASSELRRALDESAALNNQIRYLRDETERILSAAQDAAAEQGTTKLSEVLVELAVRHQKDANRWLWALFAATAILTGIVGWLVLSLGDVKTTVDVARASVEKFAAGGLLTYVVFFTSRNYRSNRHLATEYRSRATILQVSMALRESVAEDQAKDAILQAAVVSAFTAPSSGLVKSGGGDDESTLTLAMLTALRNAR